ncbi:hypothetical protein AX774_g2066 [Zancudomyces culisetae]|uniref:Uncharacterized protein n=1 Tax=Zancudomyces culisetae TaxID=1213189 RepID=A0A1R1PU26_ZANCU|nr:hypothetical protein AX774_g2066 [Zancudomyces culisetae]|eukprot:OMH84413.1 hypothetical protein AX774_g2066 [Zancudomyces culisetae]
MMVGCLSYYASNVDMAYHHFYIAMMFSRLMDILGHYYLEKKKPAIMHGNIEGLFFGLIYDTLGLLMYFGYRQELRYDLEDLVEERFEELEETRLAQIKKLESEMKKEK